MVQNPPKGAQRVIPYLVTANPEGVMRFAVESLGFAEVERIEGPGGVLMHGEVGYQDNMVMLGMARPGCDGYKSMVYCYVDDVDAHHAHAAATGAKVVTELQDMPYGDRAYGVEDPDGNQWHFATHVKDMTSEEIQAAFADAG